MTQFLQRLLLGLPLAIALIVISGCKTVDIQPEPAGPEITRIAFGSCMKQDKAQPIWTTIGKREPDLFLMIGDNVYGDTEDMDKLREKYNMLGANPEFADFREKVPVLATWDDHDYGKNDAGSEYPKKEESKKVMLEFFEEQVTHLIF